MENRRAFIIAGICFGISMFLIASFISAKEVELTAEFGDVEDAVIAIDNIPEYTIIRPNMVSMASEQGVKIFSKYRQASAAVSLSQVVGRASIVPIYRDEQVTLTKLVDQEGRPVLERQVSKDTRAMTLLVNPANAVGRLIRPGNRVDIVLVANYSLKPPSPLAGTENYEVKTLIQNVLVLATGKRIQNEVPTRVVAKAMDEIEAQFNVRGRRDFYGTAGNLVTNKQADNYKTVTVQLSPTDAEKVLYAIGLFGDSKIYFSLRNSADRDTSPIETTLLDDVLGPGSDYANTKRKPPTVTPAQPEFFDTVGGGTKPVY